MSETKIVSTGPVVTLFEAYGSGAEYVGAKVAEALGVKFLTQLFSSAEIEEGAAKKAEADGAFLRFFKSFGQENLDHLDNVLIPSDQADDDKLRLDNNKTLIETTAAGGVVLGRNGTVVLASNPKALHVKLDGKLDDRIARAASEAGISTDRARSRQIQEDKVRAAMSMRLYNWDPRQNDRFDLVINTSQVDLDTAVEMIVAASKAKAAKAS